MCKENLEDPHCPKGSYYEAEFFDLYKRLCVSDMKDHKGIQEAINK